MLKKPENNHYFNYFFRVNFIFDLNEKGLKATVIQNRYKMATEIKKNNLPKILSNKKKRQKTIRR